ncbi:adenylate/guanylate cyclase domain-containing protein [Bradyrhizobium sp. Ash2021]|uniref:adenylate/guanylate cyclase domain-containing protein n=1 Tax=Bradyrhizobium sp. Ash2021 TaxID=2954771 RepID=UPI00281688A9|nr:adenylate/guanylate cyclase domain-containing protein [Bradyrhizobium sp. Ash2021]WMT79087.1 adenylate/guanylate cyclase domain-containing protein [Bradyrhizobium sp. Ash2021]
MQRAEEATYAEFERLKRELIEPSLSRHEGRLIKTTGDGALAEFASPSAAVRCAVEIQESIASGRSSLKLRMGVNLGEVIVAADGDLFGDGINIAVRLEGVADPGGILISEKVYSEVEGKLDVGFEDRGEQQLKNIAKPVRAFAVRAKSFSALSDRPSAAPPLPDKPSIAVLPFQNMSGDPEQEYFADGMVEEIITALSPIRWLFVIARNSSFTYKGHAVDVKQAGRELGVRYVLEGSVRKAGNRMRITGQLIDAISGAHLWADHFDGTLEDVFELQDRVAVSVAGIIEPALQGAEMRWSAQQRPTDDLTAYDLYLRALAPIRSGEVSRESYVKALDLLNQAIKRDSCYAPALALAGSCRSSLDVAGWVDDASANRDEALRLTRRALAAARDDPNVLANGAYVLAYFGEDIVASIALIDRSLELNPSFAVGWWRSGWLRLWVGQLDRAIEDFETGLRLSPRVRMHDPFLGIGVGRFFARHLDEARTMLLRSLQENPNWVPTYRFLASCYAQMGRLDEAREIIERLRTLTDVVVPRATHWRIACAIRRSPPAWPGPP